MSSRRVPAVLALALALVALLAAACGGDSNSSSKTAAPAQGGSSSTTSSTLAKGTGSGSITIAGETANFDAPTCSLGTGDQALVDIQGKGNAGGRDFTISIQRKPMTTGTMETVQMLYTGTVGSVATNLASSASDQKLKVEATKVSGTFAFTGTGGAVSGDGIVQATCTKS
ncbi:MAG TPA: hypothetical protein VHN98_08690 [Acidimicrobiales bacterium]|nr:hypothetical protein [Acidimicrobiales bacterium]